MKRGMNLLLVSDLLPEKENEDVKYGPLILEEPRTQVYCVRALEKIFTGNLTTMKRVTNGLVDNGGVWRSH